MSLSPHPPRSAPASPRPFRSPRPERPRTYSPIYLSARSEPTSRRGTSRRSPARSSSAGQGCTRSIRQSRPPQLRLGVAPQRRHLNTPLALLDLLLGAPVVQPPLQAGVLAPEEDVVVLDLEAAFLMDRV